MKTFRPVYALMGELNQKIATCQKIVSPDTVAVTFTIVPDTTPENNRLQDLRQLISEITALTKELDTELDAAIEDVQKDIDSLKEERAELRKQVRDLELQ